MLPPTNQAQLQNMHVSSNTPIEGPRIHSFARKNKKELSCQKIALFGALLLLLLPLHEEVISMELKVHSHLVLGTLVLSPLHHASHLGVKPTYL
jgi:hypothetical protein